MKKIRYILGFMLAALVLGVTACDNQIADSGDVKRSREATFEEPPEAIPANHIRVYFKDKKGRTKDFWLWGDVDKDFWVNKGWGETAFNSLYFKDGFTIADIKPAATPANNSIMFIPRSAANDEGKLTGDIIFYLTQDAATAAGSQYYFTTATGKNTVWVNSAGIVVDAESKLATITKAEIVSADGNELLAQFSDLADSQTITASDVTVKSSDGATTFTVSNVADGKDGYEITLSDGNLEKAPYKVTFNGTTVTASTGAALIDNEYSLEEADIAKLQMNVDPSGSTTFTTWAPTAESVKVLLFATANDVSGTPAKTENMTKVMDTVNASKWTGKWECTTSTTGYNYYKFRIKTKLGENDVANIWSFAASVDSKASQLVNIENATSAKPTDWDASYVNPFGKTGSETKLFSDAVIYEMHIGDWSGCTTSEPLGKFEELASDDIIAHLVDLGVTHVQILPMFDYAQTIADGGYNWGYNPYHYNVPEGRYTKNMQNGVDSVKQMRTMIHKLHEAGIAVIMDVVYNHTNGTGKNSLFDMTVPEYFYRMTDSGLYSNGSGCGNEVATNHDTVARFVLESLKHWMNDYHINGFRFDLMGLHEDWFIADVVTELSKIDKNVLVYGEPWTGGDSPVEDGVTGVGKGEGYGTFDDDLRDVLKGGVFNRIEKGIVQGDFGIGENKVVNYWREDRICKNLLGYSESRNKDEEPQFTIHYAEAHDNNTLFDKLVLSHTRTTDTDHAVHVGDLFAELKTATIANKPASFTANLDYIKAQDTLTASVLLLAQGTPFLNGGQEFLRSKMGNDNSYGGEASITAATYYAENRISLEQRNKYFDVYRVYRGLIGLRQAYPEYFGNNDSSSNICDAKVLKDASNNAIHGVIEYRTGTTSECFLIYYNFTDEEKTVNLTGRVVDVKGKTEFLHASSIITGAPAAVGEKYSIAKESSTIASLPPKSFTILLVDDNSVTK